MRTLFFLLLLANLTLFGYTRLDGMGRGEGIRLAQQVQPDSIRLLTPQEVAALGPDKTAAVTDVCAEWGPINDADRARVIADLEPLALGKLLTQKPAGPVPGYWVVLAPFASRAAAEKRVAELRTAGVSDVSLAESAPQRFAVSLGVFRSEDAADARAADLARAGITNARAGPRPAAPTTAQTTFIVRNPPAAAVARLKELAPAYPGAQVRIGSCDRPAPA